MSYTGRITAGARFHGDDRAWLILESREENGFPWRQQKFLARAGKVRYS